jgi:UDP-N-acetylglucosamine 1-carboxyvinyltransferase
VSSFVITGGRRLSGTVAVSGAKNAALPMMAASILASGTVRLAGVPRLTDVDTLAALLAELGMAVTCDGNRRLAISAIDGRAHRASPHWVRRMRAGFCVLGPLLARRGRAVVPLPGGCNIGDRPVDLHLAGLAALGAEVQIERGYVWARAKRLRGTTIDMAGPHGPTVTGTANVLSAAVLARGCSVLRNVACEPEIVDLGRLLIRLGAKIEGLGTKVLRVEGVDQLGAADYKIMPDRVEAATLLLAVAAAGGRATVTGARPDDLRAVIAALRSAGFDVGCRDDRVEIDAARRARPIDLVALPYPGIPTDVQAQWTAVLSLAEGRSTICDRVFPGRFLHLAELRRLGARIARNGDTAMIDGAARLTGAPVTAGDLRASAALVLAGLAAEGETTVHEIRHLDRGYEQLDSKLRRLGGSVRRVQHWGAPSSADPHRTAGSR